MPSSHQNKSVILPIAIMALAIVSFLLLIDFSIHPPKSSTKIHTNAGLVACDQIAKLCPDGSYVSRSGPNCEFAACPGNKINPVANSKVTTNTNSSPDPTVGWKTYNSDIYGFTLQYPPDWVVKNEKIQNGIDSINFDSEDGKQLIHFFPLDGFKTELPKNERIEETKLAGHAATRNIFWVTSVDKPTLCFYSFKTAPNNNWLSANTSNTLGNKIVTTCNQSAAILLILSTLNFNVNPGFH